MYNYNVINPVNIHYTKYLGNKGGNSAVQNEEENNTGRQNALTTDENSTRERFPNGNKVAIDYTKNQINISQVLQDFRSTIAAINSPENVVEDVEAYLGLVSKESSKDEPSREIILSNLRNAARITDKYIQDSLKKPSNVVLKWVDALFQQRINLKADPNEINEDFRVKIPEKQAQKTLEHKGGLTPLKEDTVEFTPQNKEPEESDIEPYQISVADNYSSFIEQTPEETAQEETNFSEDTNGEYSIYINEPEAEFENNEAYIEPQVEVQAAPTRKEEGPYAAKTENEKLAKEILLEGKMNLQNEGSVYETLRMYDRALELMQNSDNTNLKSAIYYERARIFDSYDYAELALIEYHKATKTTDGNLRAQAHIKMGNIYDDYVQFEPAMDQYSMAIESSEEANNPQGKTRALRYIASMFAERFDNEGLTSFSDLAIESAKETKSPKTIAATYLEVADNYKYIGDDKKALQTYGALAQESAIRDDYDTLAKNYMEAAMLMDKKGNKQKSYALMVKSKEYQRLARLQRAEIA